MSQSFVRPRFDYCNIIYDKPNNESSCNVITKEQCNAPKRNLDLNHSNSGDGWKDFVHFSYLNIYIS